MIIAAVSAAFLFAGSGVAQERIPPTSPRAPEKRPVVVSRPINARAGERSDGEKKLAVTSNPSIKMCLTEGSVKVNGWDRNEVRVFVRSGTKFQFRVLERDKMTARPSWIWLAREDRTSGTECLTGEEIELDIPKGSSLTVEGRSADLMVDSIAKVDVKIVEGNAMLRNINNGVKAVTYQGDLLVENSSGSISLDSTNGNIAATAVEPTQAGDMFRAKTSGGAVALRDAAHRLIDVNSISGSVRFDGKFSPGGVYTFKTSNGSILITSPEDLSARVSASFGFGSFQTVLPINITQKTDSPGSKTVVGTFGKGDADLTLMTLNGTIAIAKRE